MLFTYTGPGSKILKDYQMAKKRRIYGPPQRTVLDDLFSQERIEKENIEKNKILQDVASCDKRSSNYKPQAGCPGVQHSCSTLF